MFAAATSVAGAYASQGLSSVLGSWGWFTQGTVQALSASELADFAAQGITPSITNAAGKAAYLGWVDDVAGAISSGTGRVFWSGGDLAKNAAINFAKANGMTTLEMTRAGQNLTKLTQDLPWDQAKPMWERLSSAYAKGAKGNVHVFQNATDGVSLKSIWRTHEFPNLVGKNNITFHNIFRL
jgi:hypothetical protein